MVSLVGGVGVVSGRGGLWWEGSGGLGGRWSLLWQEGVSGRGGLWWWEVVSGRRGSLVEEVSGGG